ncbi:MAG: 50S ribosomal protein L25 [Planctomycetes bacterium]|nr:50S ribosomal protein L25 [Planctomycetota bacterium]
MSKSENIKAQPRTKLGSRSARKLRSEGHVPASMDADASAPHRDFSIEEHLFLATRRRHVHLYDLDFSGSVESAVVRELQWDALGDTIVHVDFKRVRRDVETSADIELEFVGHPKGGMLNRLVTQLRVLCLPSDIPDLIEVPVGGLETGGSVHASDLVLPKGVKLGVSPTLMVCNVVQQKIEVAPAPVAEAAAGGTVAATPTATPGAPAPAAGKTPPGAGGKS